MIIIQVSSEMQDQGLYTPLDNDKMSAKEIASIVLTSLFLVMLPIGMVVTGSYIGARNMNTVCDSFSLFRLSTWLYASAGLAILSCGFGLIYIHQIVRRRYRNLCWTVFGGGIQLLSILWSVCGLTILLGTAVDCQQSALVLWATVVGVFAGQWVGCISFGTMMFLLFG